MHRQTVSLYHNFSVWLDTQNTSSGDRNQPNFMVLYLLSRHLDDLHQLGNYDALCISVRLYIFCATGYRSAQFVRRALHYEVDSR